MNATRHTGWNQRPRLSLLGMLVLVAAFLQTDPLSAQEAPAGGSPSTAPATGRATRSGTLGGGSGGGFASGGRGGGSVRGGRSSEPPVQMTPGEGPTAAFVSTIYEVRMPADQIGHIDIEALTKAAATTADFNKALAGLGAARTLYYVNQSVRLADESIRISADTPYVTNSQITNTGSVINSVAYTSVGTIMTLAGKPTGAGNIDLNLSIQVVTLTEGATTITLKVKAPYFRVAQMAHNGPAKSGQPFVLVSADGATLDANGYAVAYIARITLGVPADGR